MIIHVDMDAFYAAVEERDRPELAGKPVIVGGSAASRGVVAAANYAARKYGVHSAMPAATARRLCPQAVFLPSRIGRYAEVSRTIRDIFDRYTPLVEPLSLDEAFLDAAGTEQLFGSPVDIARRIKREIRDELALVASAGVAPNKFLAKLASDLGKPDGFVVVPSDGVQEFLGAIPVERVWGVGRQGARVMRGLGVRTIADLRRIPKEVLKNRFGTSGEHFWRLARGVDDRPVVPDRAAKSISHETTFAADIEDPEILRGWLSELTDQVARRLRRCRLRAGVVHVKVRFADFRTITRSQKLREPTCVTEELWRVASGILASRVPDRRLPVRLLGMGVSGMDGSGDRQELLFGDRRRKKQVELDEAADAVRECFGSAALRRGSSIPRDAQRRSPNSSGSSG